MKISAIALSLLPDLKEVQSIKQTAPLKVAKTLYLQNYIEGRKWGKQEGTKGDIKAKQMRDPSLLIKLLQLRCLK